MEQEKKSNHLYRINDLGDFMKCTKAFSNGDMLWFRGNADRNYSLLPSLYRGKTIDFTNIKNGCYTRIHDAEDIRSQQY